MSKEGTQKYTYWQEQPACNFKLALGAPVDTVKSRLYVMGKERVGLHLAEKTMKIISKAYFLLYFNFKS